MPEYVVNVKEVWDQLKVDAASEEEAFQRVRDGSGDYLDQPEYCRTMTSDSWSVEESAGEREDLDAEDRTENEDFISRPGR